MPGLQNLALLIASEKILSLIMFLRCGGSWRQLNNIYIYVSLYLDTNIYKQVTSER